METKGRRAVKIGEVKERGRPGGGERWDRIRRGRLSPELSRNSNKAGIPENWSCSTDAFPSERNFTTGFLMSPTFPCAGRGFFLKRREKPPQQDTS